MTDLVGAGGGAPIHPGSVGNDQAHRPNYEPGPLSPVEVTETRRVIMRAALLGVKLHRTMTYTEDSRRWSGIASARRSILDEVPPFSDCSSFATWCYWDATRWLALPDIVNGEHWQAGYTGTMIQHGEAVPIADALVGDLIFYGAVTLPYHVAICAGGGNVVSMGRQGAPELVGAGGASMCRRYLG